MSMSSSSSADLSPDHLSPSDEHICYVKCDFCDTILAVSVPYTSLFKTVTVRCGCCTNLLSVVNVRSLVLPASDQLGPHSYFNPQNFLEELRDSPSNMNMMINQYPNMNDMPSFVDLHQQHEIPKAPPVNRPPEKRQRVPSAYNRFIKEEIQRIKASNPDISHREAFSAAAKNNCWRKLSGPTSPTYISGTREGNQHAPAGGRGSHGDERRVLYAPAANVCVTPY